MAVKITPIMNNENEILKKVNFIVFLDQGRF